MNKQENMKHDLEKMTLTDESGKVYDLVERKVEVLPTEPSQDCLGAIISGDGDCLTHQRLTGANRYHAQGNWFPTRELAELESRRRVLIAKYNKAIRELDDGVIDWRDYGHKKYYPYWDFSAEEFAGDYKYKWQAPLLVEFARSYSSIKRALKNWPKEDIKLMLTGEFCEDCGNRIELVEVGQ